MQLLSVENLSLAAEVTAILLLLGFAWPQNISLRQPALEAQESTDWEQTKLYFLQSCLHRGLYVQQLRQRRNRIQSNSAIPCPFIPPGTEDEKGRSNVPFPWQDRLTGLVNRNGFDVILKAWLAIEPRHRGGSCLSMVTLSEYSDLVSNHGAMVTEQAIQRIADRLAVASSSESLVAKYLPDRFVVLHYSAKTTACFGTMKIVQECISEPEFFHVNGLPIALATLVCIVDLEGDAIVATRMDELDEGKMEAGTTGRNILTKVDGSWTDSPLAQEEELLESRSQFDESSPVSSKADPLNSHPDKAVTLGEAETTNIVASETTTTSNDISAVASADDIAALFEQINSNKTSQSEEVKKPSPSETDAPPATDISDSPTAGIQSEEDLNEAATVDDIASLFATVKSAAKPDEASQPTTFKEPAADQLRNPNK